MESNGTVGILDYGAGNLTSLCNALRQLKARHAVFDRSEQLAQYERVIIPGVGHAATAMQRLEQIHFVEALASYSRPVLGICLGMQLLAAHSAEGNCDLLGRLPLQVERLPSRGQKIPHVGWNTVEVVGNHRIWSGIPSGSWFYFVHSYAVLQDTEHTLGRTDYMGEFTSVMGLANYVGAQFHPEKSADAGLQFLQNFLQWKP